MIIIIMMVPSPFIFLYINPPTIPFLSPKEDQSLYIFNTQDIYSKRKHSKAMAKSFLSIALLCLIHLLFSFNFHGIVVQAASGDGQKVWCVAKPSSSDTELKNNIEYVCTQMGLDCTRIREGGACIFPDTLINHASVVMNLYFQKAGRATHNCDFSNSALIVLTDPSYGGCLYSYA
uniref:Glucan endo-1,3-beta-D-glucosidase n=2 Tax=Opuntia streptacantha TaxID=393608 RepID=A0A7C8YUT7_OPUST